jgi:hypothetical protein
MMRDRIWAAVEWVRAEGGPPQGQQLIDGARGWEFCARRECLVAATDTGNGWVEVRLNGRGEIVVSVYEPGMLTLWTAMLPEGVREARRRCPACDRFLDREGNGHLAGCPEDACPALPLQEGAR